MFFRKNLKFPFMKSPVLRYVFLVLAASLLAGIVFLSGCASSPASQPAGARDVNTPAGTPGAPNTSAILPQFDAYAEQSF